MGKRDIFKRNQINYILRTYLPTWRTNERLEEIVRWCSEIGTKRSIRRLWKTRESAGYG